jgi:hypothetical protein
VRTRGGFAPARCLPRLVILLVAAGGVAFPQEPRIELIDRLGTNLVTLHFDTDADRAYTVQYIDLLPCATNGVPGATNSLPGGGWSNLITIPAFPFNNHYVIVDSRTNQHRLYRLSVTP